MKKDKVDRRGNRVKKIRREDRIKKERGQKGQRELIMHGIERIQGDRERLERIER